LKLDLVASAKVFASETVSVTTSFGLEPRSPSSQANQAAAFVALSIASLTFDKSDESEVVLVVFLEAVLVDVELLDDVLLDEVLLDVFAAV